MSDFYTNFLERPAASHHIANLIITTGPINRRFGSPDTFHFPKMTKMDTIHGLPSQRHLHNESFTIKNNSDNFEERMRQYGNTAKQEKGQ
jgi:hypothetical protein